MINVFSRTASFFENTCWLNLTISTILILNDDKRAAEKTSCNQDSKLKVLIWKTHRQVETFHHTIYPPSEITVVSPKTTLYRPHTRWSDYKSASTTLATFRGGPERVGFERTFKIDAPSSSIYLGLWSWFTVIESALWLRLWSCLPDIVQATLWPRWLVSNLPTVLMMPGIIELGKKKQKGSRTLGLRFQTFVSERATNK
jgi:hypothetical protein